MGLVSPAALQQVAVDRNIAAPYYQVDIPIIRNQTFSQSLISLSNFSGAFSSSYAIKINNTTSTGLIQNEVNANNPVTVMRNPNGTIGYTNAPM